VAAKEVAKPHAQRSGAGLRIARAERTPIRPWTQCPLVEWQPARRRAGRRLGRLWREAVRDWFQVSATKGGQQSPCRGPAACGSRTLPSACCFRFEQGRHRCRPHPPGRCREGVEQARLLAILFCGWARAAGLEVNRQIACSWRFPDRRRRRAATPPDQRCGPRRSEITGAELQHPVGRSSACSTGLGVAVSWAWAGLRRFWAAEPVTAPPLLNWLQGGIRPRMSRP